MDSLKDIITSPSEYIIVTVLHSLYHFFYIVHVGITNHQTNLNISALHVTNSNGEQIDNSRYCRIRILSQNSEVRWKEKRIDSSSYCRIWILLQNLEVRRVEPHIESRQTYLSVPVSVAGAVNAKRDAFIGCNFNSSRTNPKQSVVNNQCDHIFHRHCITTWIKSNRNQECPIYRRLFVLGW